MFDEHDQRITLAWCVAVLNNRKRIPKLQTLLSRQRAQTPADQRAVMQSIAGHLGVTLLKRKRKKGA